jgi:hypothetical protein
MRLSHNSYVRHSESLVSLGLSSGWRLLHGPSVGFTVKIRCHGIRLHLWTQPNKRTFKAVSSSVIATGQLQGDGMARKSIEERLAQLDARRKTLQARLSQRSRVQDTRRKILMGALILQRLEADPALVIGGRVQDWVARELAGFLTRDADKELFADLTSPIEEPINLTPTKSKREPALV